MNVLPVRIPEELYEKLQILSEISTKPMAEIIRGLLKKEIKRQPINIKTKLKYVSPLKDLMEDGERFAKKLKLNKYYYPQYKDDELLYLEPWKKNKK